MPLAAGTRLGTYEIVAALGAGGMGEVYRAKDLRLGREVALKVLPADVASDADRLARFEREARVVASLNHPNIVVLHSVEDSGGVRFLTMELVEGRSLDRALAPGGLPVAQVVELGIALAEALAAAHEKGIVHRDLKPANVMLTKDGRVKVLDFGLARPSASEAAGELSQATTVLPALTGGAMWMGTAPYMAPEQVRGEAVDARTDLFALGIVLYELASGKRPFAGGTLADVSSAILRDTPAPLASARAEIPAELARVVTRCLEKNPRDRYQSALDLRNDLRELRRSIESGSVPAPPAGRRPAPARRALAWGVAAIVLAGAAAGWLALRRPAAPRGPAAGAAARRSVAVLEFENLTNDPALDWMKRGVAELLSSALVQSSTLDVFDAQRLGDLAAAEAPAPANAVPNRAFLARHGIRRLLSGTILRSGGTLHLQGRIEDTSNGRLLQSYAVEGPADSDLFHLVGQLIPKLQVALEVNLTGNREAEGWLREITTTSVEAYRLFIKGHEELLASHWRAAAAAYEQAIEIDSTFVAARAELAGVYWNLGAMPKLALTRAAMNRLRGRADHRGQLRIDLLNSVVGNDPEALVRSASALVELYPENRFFTYLLGRGYYTSQQYQRCLDTLRPLMEQRYAWAWTYVLAGRSAERLGDVATARRVFDQGYEVANADPEFVYAYVKFLQRSGARDRTRAVIERALRSPAIGESPVGEGELRLELARDLVLRGDLARARAELKRAAALIPEEDEARADADSLLKQLGME